MAITSAGIGSGLDVNGIVSQLMQVEQQPLTVLATKEAAFQATLSGLGSLRSAISSFQTSVKALTDGSKFSQIAASIGDSTIATATTASTAIAGSYSLEVSQLAQNQKITSQGFASIDSVVGTGTLTIQFGKITGTATSGVYGSGTTFDVNAEKSAVTVKITSSNNSLIGVRDAINAANASVSASIVNDGSTSGYRLVVTSKETGEQNALRILATDDDTTNADANGLSRFAYDVTATASAGQNMSESQSAKNALLKVDGLSISKSSNTISGVIDGVTLGLLKTTTTATTVSVSKSTGTISKSVESFVKGYNDLIASMKDLGAYDPATKKAGALQGEAVLRSVQYEIRGLLNTRLPYGTYTQLSQVGLTLDKDGKMQLDSTKLNTALTNNPDAVAGLFASYGYASDKQITYQASTVKSVAGQYNLNVSQLAAAAVYRGAAIPAGSVTINDTNNELSVKVNGIYSGVVTLSAGSYTGAQLAAELQTKINADSTLKSNSASVSVSFNATANRFEFTSNKLGTTSAVEFTSVDAGTTSPVAAGTTESTLGIKVGKQATYFGGTLNSLKIDDNNDYFTIKVDGESVPFYIPQATYASGEALATQFETSINTALSTAKVDVVYNATSNRLEINSRATASSSIELQTVESSSATTLGLDARLGQTSGQNVAGTFNGASALGDGQYLTGDSVGTGIKIQVTGNNTGDRGSLVFSQGFAYKLDKLMDSMLSSTGILSAKTDGVNRSIKDIASQRETLNRRLVDIQARYKAQFTALDTLVANLQSTSTFLTQQLAKL